MSGLLASEIPKRWGVGGGCAKPIAVRCKETAIVWIFKQLLGRTILGPT